MAGPDCGSKPSRPCRNPCIPVRPGHSGSAHDPAFEDVVLSTAIVVAVASTAFTVFVVPHRACECFETPSLVVPCWSRKTRCRFRRVVCSLGKRHWERTAATFRAISPQGYRGPTPTLPPRPSLINPSATHQRFPTQEIVGHGHRDHNASDFGKSSYGEWNTP